MQIQGLNAYKEPIVEDSSGLTKIDDGIKTKVENSRNGLTQSKNSKPGISENERQFFINMFPENSDQIEKHILFTRNGKIQTQDISKGVIVDGKA
ncbi:MAG: hypothetical protein ABSG15_02630 [FCB group bacterium]|jgi:hypothetical protein